jgi:hypothetical protein
LHFYTQIAARHHDAVRRADDFVQIVHRFGFFELGDDCWKEQFRCEIKSLSKIKYSKSVARFTRAEIEELVNILDVPAYIQCEKSRNKEDRITALCMLLCRLAYPTRLVDVEMQFGGGKSRFSRITYLTAAFLWQRWKHLLRFDPRLLTQPKLAWFAAAFKSKGAPLDCIAGLIDGTLQKNAHPVRNQRIVYNGWKRIHCLKYYAVVYGLVIHVHSPVDGRGHDETVYKESGLVDILDRHFWTLDH